MKRVIVCGGRDFHNRKAVRKALEAVKRKHGPFVVIHGCARGADTLAGEEARQMELGIMEFPAKWGKYGKKAGFVRNKQMLEEGKADAVIAFAGGRGTAMMVKLAKEANVPVWIRTDYRWDDYISVAD
jgi:predicted Rossmann-fold nucleotide-binding protein